MKKKELHGIIAPLVTPFDSNDTIDEALFREEIKLLIRAGVHGLSPGGSTGEGAALTDDELARLVTIIKEENSERLPIIAGVIRNSTYSAVKAGISAKEAGADALMVTPTSYNVLVPDDAGKYEFFKTISDEVGLPIIIYNVVPQNEIKTDLFFKLLDIENVIGIKQSVGGIKAMYEKVISCREKGKIYAATDDMLYSCFDLGANGAIAAILTVFPEISVQIWNCIQKGDNETAKKLQDKIYPVWQAIIGEQFPRRVKEALRQLGRNVGLPRSPILKATAKEREEIKSALDSFNR